MSETKIGDDAPASEAPRCKIVPQSVAPHAAVRHIRARRSALSSVAIPDSGPPWLLSPIADALSSNGQWIALDERRQ